MKKDRNMPFGPANFPMYGATNMPFMSPTAGMPTNNTGMFHGMEHQMTNIQQQLHWTIFY